MPEQKLLAKIHIAKKELGLDDDTYRDILGNLFLKKMEGLSLPTSTILTDREAVDLLKYFESIGWKPMSKPKKYDDQKGDLYSASAAVKRKIEAMWHDIYRGEHEESDLRKFLFRTAKVSDMRFLDKRGAYDCVEALKSMHHRRAA